MSDTLLFVLFGWILFGSSSKAVALEGDPNFVGPPSSAAGEDSAAFVGPPRPPATATEAQLDAGTATTCGRPDCSSGAQ